MAKTTREKEEIRKENEEDEWNELLEDEAKEAEEEEADDLPDRGSLVLGAREDHDFAPRPRDDYIITMAYDMDGEKTKYTDTDVIDDDAPAKKRSTKPKKKKKKGKKGKKRKRAK
jgi:hypothetical protein